MDCDQLACESSRQKNLRALPAVEDALDWFCYSIDLGDLIVFFS
jgi:hypothetical protein